MPTSCVKLLEKGGDFASFDRLLDDVKMLFGICF